MQRSVFTTSVLVPVTVALLCVGQTYGASPAEPDFAQFADTYIGMARTQNPTPLEDISDMLADGFIQITSLGRVFKGKEANMGFYRNNIAEIRASFSHLDAAMEVQAVHKHPQTAVLFGKVTMSGRLREGGAPYRREVWETMVFTKEGSKWLMVHEHSTVAAASSNGE